MPNNGLIIANSGESFRFLCRSNSSSTTDLGGLIGLDENFVVDGTFFEYRNTNTPGELNIFNSQTTLTASEQGVYTCRMPFEGGGEGEINIGVYLNGFNSELILLVQ